MLPTYDSLFIFADTDGFFAVIPTIGIGGPLAILALLFPTLFGGGFVLFRQWAAFFAVFSVCSLLAFLHLFFAEFLLHTWLGSQTTIWVALTFINLMGVLWAWRRSLPGIYAARATAPVRTEIMVLLILSVCCLAADLVYLIWFRQPALSAMWKFTWALSIGVWAGAAYRLFHLIIAKLVTIPPAPLPTEGIMLWAMLPPSLFFFVQFSGFSGISERPVSGDVETVAKLASRNAVNVEWKPGGGMVVSSPCLDEDRLYVSAAHRSGGAFFGVVYCIDRSAGKTVWSFDDDGSMKQVFSSPVVAGGKLFVGEGFHYDPDCKLYCLDANNGTKLWEYQTGSQTEATPFVADGYVYFGAGNDGVYCLDAKTGKEKWRYGQEFGKTPIFRVGAGPVVANGRVYVGSGVDRDRPKQCETAVARLDAETGKEIWKTRTDLPCWSPAVVTWGHVFFALGNGDLFTDDPIRPAGALLCLSTRDGKVIWRFNTPNGVYGKVAMDGRHVYFGCRDGNCYCVGRFDGKLRWKSPMGSPLVAGITLADGSSTVPARRIFVVSSGGAVACLDANTGLSYWYDDSLVQFGAEFVGAPAMAIEPKAGGIHRRLYIGAAVQFRALPAVYVFEDLLTAPRKQRSTGGSPVVK